MSSTNRLDAATQPANEGYETPQWVTHLLWATPQLFGRATTLRCVDPCSGTGEVARALSEVTRIWTLNDINPDAIAYARRTRMPGWDIRDAADFRTLTGTWDVAITNPPFSLAIEVVRWGLKHAGHTFVVQRLNWLGGPKSRQSFLCDAKPDILVIPNRIPFHYLRFDKKSREWVRNRQTDSIEYAWFRFPGEGRWSYLLETPREARAADFADYWARHGG